MSVHSNNFHTITSFSFSYNDLTIAIWWSCSDAERYRMLQRQKHGRVDEKECFKDSCEQEERTY